MVFGPGAVPVSNSVALTHPAWQRADRAMVNEQFIELFDTGTTHMFPKTVAITPHKTPAASTFAFAFASASASASASAAAAAAAAATASAHVS